MLNKLRRKFVLLATSVSFAVLLIIVVAINTINYTAVMDRTDALLDLLVTNDMRFADDFKPHGDRFSREIAFTTRFFVVFSDEQNNIDFVDTRNIQSVTKDQAIAYTEEIIDDPIGYGTMDDFRYVKADNGIGYSYLFVDIQPDLKDIRAFGGYSVIVAVVALLLVCILSWIFSKSAVAPIAKSYERQKRFITDVSHELKTPLAIIGANNDVMEIDHGESEWTASVKTQVARLGLLIDRLLTLTRLDEEHVAVTKAEFSLSDALTQTLEDFHAAMMHHEVHLAIEEDISYKGDEASIRKMIAILLENAVKYAPENTKIEISLRTSGAKRILSISNEAEGIAPGKYDMWFDRFYREDQARTGAKGGYGIGLSIAKGIANAHKAKISARSTDGKRIVFEVVM